MSLTFGTGPFGRQSDGRFNFRPPAHVVYVERFPRRVRATRGGVTVIDSDAVVLVHEHDALPHYAFPNDDVQIDASPEEHAAGHVRVPWDAVDEWFEEDERIEVHPRDPYHRIDTLATSRRVTVAIGGVPIAETTQAKALYETSLPVRYYMPLDDVRMDVLEVSDTVTQCAYKGTARHWSARVGDAIVPDVAWSYDGPVNREAEDVQGRIAFYNERVDIALDGVGQERPRTKWSSR